MLVIYDFKFKKISFNSYESYIEKFDYEEEEELSSYIISIFKEKVKDFDKFLSDYKELIKTIKSSDLNEFKIKDSTNNIIYNFTCFLNDKESFNLYQLKKDKNFGTNSEIYITRDINGIKFEINNFPDFTPNFHKSILKKILNSKQLRLKYLFLNSEKR